MDTGERAYTGREVTDRLGGPATSSILTYGLTNTLPAVHNIHVQSRNRLSALGEKKLRTGEMPTPRELEAMNLSESEALGRMVLFQLEELDTAAENNHIDSGDSLNQPVEAASKREILERNRLQGRAYEQQEFLKFSEQYFEAAEQITIRTASGRRTRVDAIGIDADGNVVIYEFKSSSTARVRKNQKLAFKEIEESGGVVTGEGSSFFKRDYAIPAGTQVKIVRP